MRNLDLFVLMILAAMLLAAGCTTGPSAGPAKAVEPGKTPTPSSAGGPTTPTPSVSQDKVKFGALLPLTGSLANVGEGMRDAMLLAVEDVNAAGGVNGKPLEFIIEDTGCDPAKAVSAINKLLTVDRIVALAGPTCSGESLATAPILNDSMVVTLSPSATNPKLTAEGGDYWFRVSPSDAFQGKLAAKYAKDEKDAKRAAILYLNNDWGVGLRDAFKSSFVAIGGQVVAEESIPADATDVRTQVTKIKAANPDLVYLPCFPKECAVALKQLYELGVRVPVMGADGGDDPKTLTELGVKAEGFIITIPSGAGDEFTQKYRAKYGKEPGAYGAHSYDVVRLLAQAAAKGGANGPAMKDYLYGVEYTGYTGTVKFDRNGDLTSARYDLKVWQNGSFSLVRRISG